MKNPNLWNDGVPPPEFNTRLFNCEITLTDSQTGLSLSGTVGWDTDLRDYVFVFSEHIEGETYVRGENYVVYSPESFEIVISTLVTNYGVCTVRGIYSYGGDSFLVDPKTRTVH